MVLPVKVYSGGMDTLLRLDFQQNNQVFDLPFDRVVDSLQFDPAYQIISRNNILTSNDNVEFDTDLRVFPNPTDAVLNVVSSTDPIENISIYDNLGILRYVDTAVDRKQAFLDLSTYMPGIYHMKIGYKNLVRITIRVDLHKDIRWELDYLIDSQYIVQSY